jgi:activator of HSP90 ATPase
LKTIKKSYFIKSSLPKVWDALVNPKDISAWGGGPAKMGGKEGFEFFLWGGSIWGKNTQVIFQKKLVQDWFSETENKKWESPSIATFILSEEENGVKLELIHANVPDEDANDIDKGWDDYYLGPLKDYLEK